MGKWGLISLQDSLEGNPLSLPGSPLLTSHHWPPLVLWHWKYLPSEDIHIALSPVPQPCSLHSGKYA